MVKRKRTKRQTKISTTLYRKLKIERNEPERSGRVSRYCSFSGTCRVALVTKTSDKSLIISGGWDCDYGKRKISVFITYLVKIKAFLHDQYDRK